MISGGIRPTKQAKNERCLLVIPTDREGVKRKERSLMIKKNMIRCKHCGDVIESKSEYDFKTCSCGSCSVDGGHYILRRLYKNSPDEDFEELSVIEKDDSSNIG